MKDLMKTMIAQEFMNHGMDALSYDDFLSIANEVQCVDKDKDIWVLDFDGFKSWYSLSVDFKLILSATENY